MAGFSYNPLSGMFDLVGGSSLSIGSPIGGSTAYSLLSVSATNTLDQLGPLTDGQLLIGDTGGAAIPATLTGTANQVNIANGAGSITLSLPQDIAILSSPEFAGLTLTGFSGPVKATAGVLSSSAIDLASAEVTNILTNDKGGTGLDTSAATNGQILIGNGTGFTLAALTGTVNQVNVTNGAGSITLSTPQDIATTSTPTFSSLLVSPAGGIDTTGAGTLAIGTTNATVINIGNAGVTVNVQGTTFYQNVTDLVVTDKRITLNSGGSVGSASNSGIEIEENAIITAYVDTSADRLSWELKAPASVGIVTITPGAGGFTIDQGSHDPVTIGTANGLSLSTQVLSMDLADGIVTGTISPADYNSFTGKVDGPASSVDGEVALFNGVTGKLLKSATQTGVAKLTAGVLSASNVDLTSEVSNTLPIANGGTNSSTALVNSRVMVSTGGAIVESSTTTTQLSYLDATSSIQTQLDNKVDEIPTDIVNTTWAGLANNTANQTITGFLVATTVSSFEALVNVYIDATTDLFTTVKILGTRKDLTDWTNGDIQWSQTGDAITGLDFSITNAGQMEITIGSIVGFVSGAVKFRAITV